MESIERTAASALTPIEQPGVGTPLAQPLEWQTPRAPVATRLQSVVATESVRPVRPFQRSAARARRTCG